jgi:hypothetical protein
MSVKSFSSRKFNQGECHAESQILFKRAQRQALKAFPPDDAQVGPKI